MFNANEFENDIKKMRIEYDISAVSTQLIDEKRKLLEIKKNMFVVSQKIEELQGRINEKKQELESLG